MPTISTLWIDRRDHNTSPDEIVRMLCCMRQQIDVLESELPLVSDLCDEFVKQRMRIIEDLRVECWAVIQQLKAARSSGSAAGHRLMCGW